MTTAAPSRESVSSIQLALELEHQLGENSPPATPIMSQTLDHHEKEYDSDVLTSIIIQLRANLATVTQERDESVHALALSGPKTATLEAKAADLGELLEAERKRAEKLEEEKDLALRQAQENEDQINLLRERVDESRRGVMRLQAENRRMSAQPASKPLPLDLSTTLRSPGASAFNSVKSSKRASFQLNPSSTLSPPSALTSRPIASSGHRRISSLSDPGPMPDCATPTALSDPVNIIDGLPPSPATHTFEDIRNGDGNMIKTKRLSLLVKRDASPPGVNSGLPSLAEFESMKAEVASTRRELENLKRELAESNDKREAADACIKALREFIAEQALGENVAPSSSSVHESIGSPVTGLKGLRLPPLPSEQDSSIDDQTKTTAQKKGGWGLKLWGTPTTIENLPVLSPPPQQTDANSASSTPLTSFVSSWSRSVSSNSVAQPEPSPQTAGLSRKFSLFKRTPAVATPPPELTYSESTSPQTDTRSLTSGVLSFSEELDQHHHHEMTKEKMGGDLTPTLPGSEHDASPRVETLEVVAL